MHTTKDSVLVNIFRIEFCMKLILHIVIKSSFTILYLICTLFNLVFLVGCADSD